MEKARRGKEVEETKHNGYKQKKNYLVYTVVKGTVVTYVPWLLPLSVLRLHATGRLCDEQVLYCIFVMLRSLELNEISSLNKV